MIPSPLSALPHPHKMLLYNIFAIYHSNAVVGEFEGDIFWYRGIDGRIPYHLTVPIEVENLCEILPLAIAHVATIANPNIDPLVQDPSQMPYFEGFYVTGFCTAKTFAWKIKQYVGCGQSPCICQGGGHNNIFIKMTEPTAHLARSGPAFMSHITTFVTARAGTARNLGLIPCVYTPLPY